MFSSTRLIVERILLIASWLWWTVSYTALLGRRYLSTVEQKLTIGWWRPYYLILLLLSIFISSYLMDGNTKYLAVHFFVSSRFKRTHNHTHTHAESLSGHTLHSRLFMTHGYMRNDVHTQCKQRFLRYFNLDFIVHDSLVFRVRLCVYLCLMCAHMRRLDWRIRVFVIFQFLLFCSRR